MSVLDYSRARWIHTALLAIAALAIGLGTYFTTTSNAGVAAADPCPPPSTEQTCAPGPTGPTGPSTTNGPTTTAGHGPTQTTPANTGPVITTGEDPGGNNLNPGEDTGGIEQDGNDGLTTPNTDGPIVTTQPPFTETAVPTETGQSPTEPALQTESGTPETTECTRAATPVTVSVDPSASGLPVQAAIDMWNAAGAMISTVEPGEAGGSTIEIVAISEPNGVSTFTPPSAGAAGLIEVNVYGSEHAGPEEVAAMVAHELGHALGLADGVADSIMGQSGRSSTVTADDAISLTEIPCGSFSETQFGCWGWVPDWMCAIGETLSNLSGCIEAAIQLGSIVLPAGVLVKFKKAFGTKLKKKDVQNAEKILEEAEETIDDLMNVWESGGVIDNIGDSASTLTKFAKGSGKVAAGILFQTFLEVIGIGDIVSNCGGVFFG